MSNISADDFEGELGRLAVYFMLIYHANFLKSLAIITSKKKNYGVNREKPRSLFILLNRF